MSGCKNQNPVCIYLCPRAHTHTGRGIPLPPAAGPRAPPPPPRRPGRPPPPARRRCLGRRLGRAAAANAVGGDAAAVAGDVPAGRAGDGPGPGRRAAGERNARGVCVGGGGYRDRVRKWRRRAPACSVTGDGDSAWTGEGGSEIVKREGGGRDLRHSPVPSLP